MDDRLDVSTILQRMMQVVSSNRAAVLIYVAAMAGVSILIQALGEEEWSVTLIYSVAGLAADYLLLRWMLVETGLKREGEGGGFGAYFAIGLLSGLALILGFLLLVIPGVILLVRWVAAESIVLSEDRGVSESLSESWSMTEPHFWPLLAVTLLGFLPYVVFVLLLGVGSGFYEAIPLDGWAYQVGYVLTDALASLYGVFMAAFSVAVYWLLRGDRRDIEQVFA